MRWSKARWTDFDEPCHDVDGAEVLEDGEYGDSFIAELLEGP
jgi:hypothetical protein